MGELGIDKLVLIFVVVLLLFGAKRLPEVSASLGKGIRELKRGLTETSAPPGADAEASPRPEPRRPDGSPSAPPELHGGEPKRLRNDDHTA